MANNIYRQAKQLRNDKPVLERNEEESEVIKIAMMPLLQLRQFSDIPIDDGLDELAEIVDEAQRMMVAASRGRAVVARKVHDLEVAGSNPAPATNVN